MVVLATGIPHLYDLAIDGKGYLLAHEMSTPFAQLRTTESFRKVGREREVDRQDFSEEMSENKLDDLRWSSQRSWFGGYNQRRKDGPQSNVEKFYRSKNLDTFRKRGEASISQRLERVVTRAGFNSGTGPPYGLSCVSGTDARYSWLSPTSSTAWQVRSVADLTFTPISNRSITGFSGDPTGMCSDGQYIYVSGSAGVFKGDSEAPTTALTSITSQAVEDISFVKERIMGWRASGGAHQIWEISSTGTTNLVMTHEIGMRVGGITTLGPVDVFCEIKGFIAWVAASSKQGELWLWDGENDPFKAAVFPNVLTKGCYAYAESVLYTFGQFRNPSTSPNQFNIIQCEISASGDCVWDVVHQGDGVAFPSFTCIQNEIFFPVLLADSEINGLDEDVGLTTISGKDGNFAACIGSLNVANNAFNPTRFWGRHDSTGALAGPLFNGESLSEFQLRLFKNQLVFSDSDGEVRVEMLHEYAARAELVSSLIDNNIDSEKIWLMGEIATEPLTSAGQLAQLYYGIKDPEAETPAWIPVGNGLVSGKNYMRARLSPEGVKSPFIFYRVVLVNGTDVTPVLRKAGLGGTARKKPSYDYYLSLKALEHMTLRDGSSPWPKDRQWDTVIKELEDLYDSQKVVEFQEPTGRDPRPPVRVQVKEFESKKTHVPNEGWAGLMTVRLSEVPPETP